MTERFEPIHIESLDKQDVFAQTKKLLAEADLQIIDSDINRPWGFFLSVDESQAADFIKVFYEGVDLSGIDIKMPLRPKILGIQPHQRLSLQTHERRNEIWRGISGEFNVVMGQSETALVQKLIKPGQVIVLPQGIIHRGIGLSGWGLAAEIWQHTDPTNPSDEDDIVRLQDDYARK